MAEMCLQDVNQGKSFHVLHAGHTLQLSPPRRMVGVSTDLSAMSQIRFICL